MDNPFPNKHLILNLCYHHLPIFPEHNDIVQVRTITYILILPQPCADKSIRTVHVKFNIRERNSRSFHLLKSPQLRFTLPALTIFLLQPRSEERRVGRERALRWCSSTEPEDWGELRID